MKTKRLDYEINHAAIKKAFYVLAAELKRTPTLAEIAEQCNCALSTVSDHLKKIKPGYRTSTARLLTEDVLIGNAQMAMKGRAANVKLHMQLLHGWQEKIMHDISPGRENELPVDTRIADTLRELEAYMERGPETRLLSEDNNVDESLPGERPGENQESSDDESD